MARTDLGSDELSCAQCAEKGSRRFTFWLERKIDWFTDDDANASPLKVYIPTPGPYQSEAQKLYDQLRENIISNVFKEYQRTGYVWEQYDATTGEGKRSHPFTGWTSLVTLSKSPVLAEVLNL